MHRVKNLLVCLFLTISLNAQFDSNCRLLVNHEKLVNLKNKIPLNANDSTYQLFLLGENHDYFNDNLLLELLFYSELKTKYPSLQFLREASFAETMLLNQFLENNDSSIFQMFSKKDCSYIDELTSLKKLYDNSKVKFKFIGIDITHKSFVHYSLLAIFKLLDSSNITEDTENLPEELSKLRKLMSIEDGILYKNKKNYVKHFTQICETIYEYKEVKKRNYQKILKENYDDFMRIVEDYCLVVFQINIVGYSFFNFILASAEVNCQSIPFCFSFRLLAQV